MRVPFVLRLDPERLSAGEFAGDIEDVRSGRRHAVHKPQDIVDFCITGREEVAAAPAARPYPPPTQPASMDVPRVERGRADARR